MSRKADYVYKNRDDTVRVRIFRVEAGWSYDAVKLGLRNTRHWRHLTDDGDVARTKAWALDYAEGDYGTLTPIDVENVTDGWPDEIPLEPTKDEHVKIEEGQTWRMGSRRLRVLAVSRHWNAGRAGVPSDALEVYYQFVDPSGRERGTMIVGRASARQRTSERRFREKFRYVG
jgi:hypothetical protein